METKVWRAHLALWWLIGPAVIFSGSFTLLILFSPLWNQFTSDKAPPLQLAFLVLIGAPLFSWMTIGLLRPMQVEVRADEVGLYLRDNDRKGSGLRLIENTVRWEEVRALYTKGKSPPSPLFLWTGEREIAVPCGLRDPEMLRAEIEKRTGLSVEIRRFPPADERFLLQWDGSHAFRHQIKSSIVGWLIWLFFVVGFWVLIVRFVWPNTTPEMLPPLFVAIGTMALGTLYGLGNTIWEFRRLAPHRDENWRFEWHAITREKAGETTVLPLDALEKIELAPANKLRASGGGIVLEWPRFANVFSREEEFLRERLAAR